MHTAISKMHTHHAASKPGTHTYSAKFATYTKTQLGSDAKLSRYRLQQVTAALLTHATMAAVCITAARQAYKTSQDTAHECCRLLDAAEVGSMHKSSVCQCLLRFCSTLRGEGAGLFLQGLDFVTLLLGACCQPSLIAGSSRLASCTEC